jgi:hypothetical protein
MYRPGETVIVTQHDTNRVGVVLDTFLVNKSRFYDVLLENRSALCIISTSTTSKTRINKVLTKQLCETGQIQTTISYKDLAEQELLPITKS